MPSDILSKAIVQNYMASYKGSSDAVTSSACDLSDAATFAVSVKNLAKVLKAGLTDGPPRAAISDARNRVQEYEVNDNVDLIDYCGLLAKASVPDVIRNACNDVIAALRSSPKMIIASGYYGSEMKGSNGVPIYVPTRTVSPLYAKLDFAKKTGWGTFLKKYVVATRSGK